MPRRKLIDYLNNPMLLKSISVEEMQAWAAEVPYAGLVQKLLAQKLVMEGAGQKDLDHASAMIVLSHANPEHALRSVEDFKKMILSEEVKGESQYVDNQEQTVLGGHSVSDIDEATTDSESEHTLSDNIKEDFAEQPLEVVEPHQEDLEVATSSDAVEEDESFTSWLSSLSSIDIMQKNKDSDMKLVEEAPVSDTLAKLLVKQGHYTKALEMYEKLMLKYPQKSTFFAAQITKIKEL